MPTMDSCSSYTNTYMDNRYILFQINRLNNLICCLQKSINTGGGGGGTSLSIEGKRIEFTVGDGDTISMNDGDDTITIADDSIIVDTVEVSVAGAILSRKASYPALSYDTPIYTTGDVTINFNQPLSDGNEVIITYLKTSS